MTGADRADDGDRLAIVHAAHERVQLGEGAPFGCDAIVLSPEGRPPPEAPADPAGLASKSAFQKVHFKPASISIASRLSNTLRASRPGRPGCLRRAVADGTTPLLHRPAPAPWAGAVSPARAGPGRPLD